MIWAIPFLIWIALELHFMRVDAEKSGVPALTAEVRALVVISTRYLRRFYPQVLSGHDVSRGTSEEKPPVASVEMTPEKFKELRYRTRLTPEEAAAAYEEKARVRMEKELASEP